MRNEQAKLVTYIDKLNQENAQLDYMATTALQANAEKDKLIKASERAEGVVSEKDQNVENIVLQICTKLEKIIQVISSSCQGKAINERMVKALTGRKEGMFSGLLNNITSDTVYPRIQRLLDVV